MRVERILKISGYRIFRSYRWPTELQAFSRYNLIYGWNGSGKTTISGLFRALEKRAAILEGDVEFAISGGSVRGQDIPSAGIPAVRVFNRDSVDRSVFESKSVELAPIYYIGEDSVDKQREVEVLRAKEQSTSEYIARIQAEKRKADKALEDFCSEKALEIKRLLTRQGGGRYSTYNSTRYKAAAGPILDSKDVALEDAERQRLQAVALSNEMPTLPSVPEPKVDVYGLMKELTDLLQREVTSNPIGFLLERPDASSWVQAGIFIHEKHGSKDCIYCGGILSEDRVRALGDHFNDQVKRLNSDIDSLIGRISSARTAIESASLPSKAELYPHLASEYEKHLNTFRAFQQNLVRVLERMVAALHSKKDSPFKAMSLDLVPLDLNKERDGVFLSILKLLAGAAMPLSGFWAASAIDRISDLVAQHNEHSSEFSNQISTAQDRLERDFVASTIGAYQDRLAEVARLSEEEGNAKSEREALSARISTLESQIVEHRRPVEELNFELASYLGHSDIQFEVLETGYRIVRNGVPALNLSEGERTAIAFMYFLKSLRGTDFDLEGGVVVVDDPVSSLDSNSLYSAFSFMKERLRDSGQLIVMTHNFEFFRLVKSWLGHMPKVPMPPGASRRDVSYYMLRTYRDDTGRRSEIGSLDRLLLDYESDYHYLFKLVFAAAANPEEVALEQSYTLPNVARRLLEAVFAFKSPGVSGLQRQMEKAEYESAVKTRILRFLHVHSHSDRVGGVEHDLFTLSEARSVMRDVLRLIASIDRKHYEGMVLAIGRQLTDLDLAVVIEAGV